MFQEARGVTQSHPLRDQGRSEDPAVVMGARGRQYPDRPSRARTERPANPAIGNGYDSQLWKALAYARQGKWADAREKFKNAEFAIAALRWKCSAW